MAVVRRDALCLPVPRLARQTTACQTTARQTTARESTVREGMVRGGMVCRAPVGRP
ncbi:hypothetical protein N5079_35120 [Planotetraspora sp. A-T 1434]|uniref:hypothetical protein n=1 Tax=Planotetraspora sp. A-T 1434 TaxID=2979219 RepID=UPI0021C2099F|nr:hypothetical protein [Planotetraspora sp. A-T 1434]MCT9935445.1 hypothetical protein [Planotetraspora sp. A-T 1434]